MTSSSHTIPRTLRHITLSTGHVRETPRSEVSDETIEMLKPIVHQALTGSPAALHTLGPGWTLSGGVDGDGCALTIWGPPAGKQRLPVATVGIAPSPLAANAVWRSLTEQASTLTRVVRDLRPLPPWCAVRLDPGIAVYPVSSRWLGDLERCLAWTWIEMQGQSGTK